MSTVSRHNPDAAERAKGWWFLARFYDTRPDNAFIAELRSAFVGAGEALGADELALWRCIDAGNPAPEDDLLPEYTRLFRGIAEHYGPPPPYESLYRGATAMGDVAMAVAKSYAASGLDGLAGDNGPPDHLATELRFLSLLSHREMAAWDAGDDDGARQALRQQRAFLDHHLLTWLPDYADTIAGAARSPFYPAVVRLTAGLATDMRETMNTGAAPMEAT
ncbi:MAG: molecular chaperone TorD family protein [Gammaproteobacteria bacterium]|nr:molecular chaperone TorD family protein [Gammaproteobacteria bacterium]